MIQRFVLRVQNKSSASKVFNIHPNQNAEENDDTKPVFIKIRTFGPGDCFGLGRFPLK